MMVRALVAMMGTLMMFGVGVNAWRLRSAALGYLAAWFAVLAGAALNRYIHQQANLTIPPQVDVLTVFLTLLAGPLVLNYVHHSLRGRGTGWWAYTPVVAMAGLAILYGPQLVSAFGVRRSLLVSACYTLGSVWLYLRAWRSSRTPALPAPAVGGVLVMLLSIHLAQLAQLLLGPRSHPLVYYSVAGLIGCWLFAALLMVVIQSPFLRTFVPARRDGGNGVEREHFARIERVMREQRPWSAPEFELAHLAELTGLTANQVSRALTRAGSTNFIDFVNVHRVRESERLLLDPAESRYKVESLGRQAGFPARSTFFKVFREYTGLTPAEYRIARKPQMEDEPRPAAP